MASFENIFQQSRKLGKLQTDVGTKFNSEFSNLPQRENVSNFENKKRKIFYDLFFSASVIMSLMTWTGRIALSGFFSSPAGKSWFKQPYLCP